MIYKVNIECNEMLKWFNKNNLENTVDNREEYVNYKLQKFLQDPIIK